MAVLRIGQPGRYIGQATVGGEASSAAALDDGGAVLNPITWRALTALAVLTWAGASRTEAAVFEQGEGPTPITWGAGWTSTQIRDTDELPTTTIVETDAGPLALTWAARPWLTPPPLDAGEWVAPPPVVVLDEDQGRVDATWRGRILLQLLSWSGHPAAAAGAEFGALDDGIAPPLVLQAWEPWIVTVSLVSGGALFNEFEAWAPRPLVWSTAWRFVLPAVVDGDLVVPAPAPLVEPDAPVFVLTWSRGLSLLPAVEGDLVVPPPAPLAVDDTPVLVLMWPRPALWLPLPDQDTIPTVSVALDASELLAFVPPWAGVFGGAPAIETEAFAVAAVMDEEALAARIVWPHRWASVVQLPDRPLDIPGLLPVLGTAPYWVTVTPHRLDVVIRDHALRVLLSAHALDVEI